MSRPSIGPGDEVLVRGPNTLYRWVGLETSGADATVQLRTVDGLDWSADRPPLPEEGSTYVLRLPDEPAREAFAEQGSPIDSLPAARVGIEHVEHHGRPLRFVGSTLAGGLVEHRFACTDRACPVRLAWSVTS